jgi:hypothetical protein
VSLVEKRSIVCLIYLWSLVNEFPPIASRSRVEHGAGMLNGYQHHQPGQLAAFGWGSSGLSPPGRPAEQVVVGVEQRGDDAVDGEAPDADAAVGGQPLA